MPKKPHTRSRVMVAMSGGVDSAVSAALLADEGYDVVGVTMQLYDQGVAAGAQRSCCAGRDIADARRTARHLGIPHYVLDYESRFREAVIEKFAESYQAGETPVPCVLCNERLKFRDLMDAAREIGAEFLATGHYVRRIDGDKGPELHTGADAARDQSYFLFTTTREQLEFLRFPVGGMTKDETRTLAQQFGIPVAEKPDSQDICFVPSGDYAETVERLRPHGAGPGNIVDIDGRVLGRHAGITHFTVGQRRGLGIGGGAPLFVLRIDAEAAEVIVGPRDALGVRSFRIAKLNWLGSPIPPDGARVGVRVRSTRAPKPARVHPIGGGGARITLDLAEEGVAPGQACVFYDGTRVLGGGWIRAATAWPDEYPKHADLDKDQQHAAL